jgi:hypothetical protein
LLLNLHQILFLEKSVPRKFEDSLARSAQRQIIDWRALKRLYENEAQRK